MCLVCTMAGIEELKTFLESVDEDRDTMCDISVPSVLYALCRKSLVPGLLMML